MWPVHDTFVSNDLAAKDSAPVTGVSLPAPEWRASDSTKQFAFKVFDYSPAGG